MDKKTLRKRFLALRNQLSLEQAQKKSEVILKKLEGLNAFQEAASVLFYMATEKEVQTLPLMKKYLSKKKIYLPRLISESEFEVTLCNNLATLKPNRFGILETPSLLQLEPSALDLILIPGLAFDRQGNRLGMGKGYYDRFLSQHKNGLRIGLAYQEQILDQLPQDPYDEGVDRVITDEEILNVKS